MHNCILCIIPLCKHGHLFAYHQNACFQWLACLQGMKCIDSHFIRCTSLGAPSTISIVSNLFQGTWAISMTCCIRTAKCGTGKYGLKRMVNGIIHPSYSTLDVFLAWSLETNTIAGAHEASCSNFLQLEPAGLNISVSLSTSGWQLTAVHKPIAAAETWWPFLQWVCECISCQLCHKIRA